MLAGLRAALAGVARARPAANFARRPAPPPRPQAPLPGPPLLGSTRAGQHLTPGRRRASANHASGSRGRSEIVILVQEDLHGRRTSPAGEVLGDGHQAAALDRPGCATLKSCRRRCRTSPRCRRRSRAVAAVRLLNPAAQVAPAERLPARRRRGAPACSSDGSRTTDRPAPAHRLGLLLVRVAGRQVADQSLAVGCARRRSQSWSRRNESEPQHGRTAAAKASRSARRPLRRTRTARSPAPTGWAGSPVRRPALSRAARSRRPRRWRPVLEPPHIPPDQRACAAAPGPDRRAGTGQPAARWASPTGRTTIADRRGRAP